MGGAKSSSSARSGGVVAVAPVATVAPTLPEGTHESRNGQHRRYFYTSPEGNQLLFIAEARPLLSGTQIVQYEFQVNQRYIRTGSIEPRDRQNLALATLRIAKYDVSNRPEGSLFSVSASTGDNLGASRARAYAAFGFSSTSSPGDGQYAVKRNGRLQPLTEAQFSNLYDTARFGF